MKSHLISETPGARDVRVWVVTRGERHVATVRGLWRAGPMRTQIEVHVPGVARPTHIKVATGSSPRWTDALAGALIDGWIMAEDCGHEPICAEVQRLYAASYLDLVGRRGVEQIAQRNGLRFANRGPDGRWQNCYVIAGLDRLTEVGYSVIRAL